MYDIHCHLLNGIDNRAKNMEETIEMCKIASKEGIKAIIATPHYIDSESQIKLPKLFSQIELVNEELKSRNINLTVLAGMEVYITHDLDRLYEEKKIITLNCRKYMLIELPLHFNVPTYLYNTLFNIELKGIRPIIAHPERCKAVIKCPNIVYDLIHKDCLIQIDSGSLEGLYGAEAKKTANILLEHNLAHIISSDSHSGSKRKSFLKKSYEIISRRFEKKLAKDLFYNNPLKVINGEDIYAEDPMMIVKKKFWFL